MRILPTISEYDCCNNHKYKYLHLVHQILNPNVQKFLCHQKDIGNIDIKYHHSIKYISSKLSRVMSKKFSFNKLADEYCVFIKFL